MEAAVKFYLTEQMNLASEVEILKLELGSRSKVRDVDVQLSLTPTICRHSCSPTGSYRLVSLLPEDRYSKGQWGYASQKSQEGYTVIEPFGNGH